MKQNANDTTGKTKSDTAAQAPDQDGLFLVGVVRSRSRRVFDKKGGGQRYNIGLSVLTSSGLIRVERWCDLAAPADTPEVGASVRLPVTLQHYSTRNGNSGVRILWGEQDAAERF